MKEKAGRMGNSFLIPGLSYESTPGVALKATVD
jgi:hypothetical protein